MISPHKGGHFEIDGTCDSSLWGLFAFGMSAPDDPWIKATEEREFKVAADILRWVAEHALPWGVLAEQLHPYSCESLSVSPLTWSHGTFVATTQRYIRRIEQKEGVISSRAEDWIGRLFGEACDTIYGACLVK